MGYDLAMLVGFVVTARAQPPDSARRQAQGADAGDAHVAIESWLSARVLGSEASISAAISSRNVHDPVGRKNLIPRADRLRARRRSGGEGRRGSRSHATRPLAADAQAPAS